MVVVVVTDELPFVKFFVNENLQSARNVDIKCNEHNRKCTTQQRKRKYVHMIPTETVTDALMHCGGVSSADCSWLTLSVPSYSLILSAGRVTNPWCAFMWTAAPLRV